MNKSKYLTSNSPIERPLHSSYLRPGTREILKSRAKHSPPERPQRRAQRPPQGQVLPAVAAPRALGSRGPCPARRYSGLGGAGRSRGRRAAGAGGEGRSERVGDTRGGAGKARRPHPALGRNRPGVASAPGASGEETCAAADQHQHPAPTQLLCAFAALRATALPPAPAPGPSPSPRSQRPREGPGSEQRPREPPALPPGSPAVRPSAFSAPTCLAYASALSRSPDCPPT